jgi:hypothetical protein
MEINSAMIPITTSNSTKVNPRADRLGGDANKDFLNPRMICPRLMQELQISSAILDSGSNPSRNLEYNLLARQGKRLPII